MKALSVIQPWATLIAIRAKEFETRHWSTPYRGPIAIHASKWRKDTGGIITGKVTDCLRLCLDEPFRSALTQGGIERIADLPSGAVVAIARLADVVRTEALVVDDYEGAFGNFQPGRYAWKLSDVAILPAPIPYRGERGLWELPDSVLEGATHARG